MGGKCILDCVILTLEGDGARSNAHANFVGLDNRKLGSPVLLSKSNLLALSALECPLLSAAALDFLREELKTRRGEQVIKKEDPYK